MISNRAVPTLLIVVSLALQGLATTRLLCPPKSFTALAPLRIASPTSLWPFTEYPMFSGPHRRGDSLAWVEARVVDPDRASVSLGRYEVWLEPGDASWERAFEREERRLRSMFRPASGSAGVVFERRRLVLTSRGLVPPETDSRLEAPR